MGIKITGLKEFEKKINQLQKKAEDLSGGRQVPFSELFNEDFMIKYTRYSSFNEMLENSGFKVDNQEDFRAIPDKEWDEYIVNATKFENWQEMMQKAGTEYYKKQLGL